MVSDIFSNSHLTLLFLHKCNNTKIFSSCTVNALMMSDLHSNTDNYKPRVGSGAVRIRRTPCPGQRSKRHTKSGCRLFCYLAQFFLFLLCLGCMCHFVSLFSVVSTSAIDCLERRVSEMTYYVSSGMLDPIYSLIDN